ncbi:MAG: amidohydrolase [Candidatus Rokubacteria bacterium]|nr:amidohydrolase [Candidatus Rokubacteria bacterium]
MRIDVHAHYYPAAYLDFLDGMRGASTVLARAGTAGDRHADLEVRFSEMDVAGVDLQVLSLSTVLPYAEDESAAVAAARLANDLYADAVERYPGRLRAFAALPLPHVGPTLAEIERCSSDARAVGFSIGTSVLGRPISDPAFEPVFRELDRRGSALFIHPAGVGACSPLVPSTGIGPTIEDTMAIWHLIDSGLIVRYPRIKIIVSHAGGAFPLLTARLDRHHASFSTHLSEPPSVTARRLWYDTVTHASVPALRCAIEAFGADRLLLGTDFPYSSYPNAVSYLEGAGLSDEALRGVNSETARSLLGMALPLLAGKVR